ncbi:MULTISPECIES: GNAT family N-acetyltransferase [Aestuariibaculum]|uniref:GNAT family N-acetyltransferase n=1 Tax=Aestuariibaculum marinum TaxID=2683592 RepID=A0A8J6U7L4_9FLAO|nr:MULTISPECIES: GNAT family N-acetyltransferase [Aestuariibaculum]MBD0823151.1 GNAT family N-acetyltransferase [Aestuariibaculum marinum]WMI66852.1 GNAT family N-acetyltransferase [Aestuariibaculum sp. YM273]
MNFTIRKAEKADMTRVLELINQLAVFEKEPDAVEVTLEDLEKDGFGNRPAFECLVAEVNGKVQGTAIMFHRYSTWKGRILHLEDLVVSEDMRGAGIGTALLDEVVKFGYDLGVRRINWEVLDWNTPAINLYEKKGANVLRDWNVVHLSEQGIKDYIANL